MAGLFGKRPNAGQQTVYTGIQLQTSAQGITVPASYGTARVGVNLLWYAGFKATKTGSGGKGGAIGAATGKGSGSTYAYSANVILGIGEGPIQGYGQAWASKTPTTLSSLGLTAFLGTYPQAIWSFVSTNYPSDGRPYTGLAYLGGSNYQLGSMAELPQHTVELYGFFSQRSVYTTTTIPGSPFTVTVGNRTWADGSTHSMWVANVAIPGFTATGGAPAAGQYKVVNGVYTFNAADSGTAITIQWTGQGQDADPALVVNDVLTNANYGAGFPPSQVGEMNAYTETDVIPGSPFHVTVANFATFDDNLSVYHSASDTLFTCVASNPGPLQYSYVAGTYTFNAADAGKSVDISYAALAPGILPTFQAYCWANAFFISPDYVNQQAASAVLDEIAKYTNSEVVSTSGALKLVPRGDQVISANGYVYTPPAATVIDLNDTQLMANTAAGGASGAVTGSDPVLVTRKRVSDQKNVVQIECLDRTNQYNTAIVEATDQANLDRFGRRTSGSQQAHLFCDPNAAKQSAQLLLQREGVRNQFSFMLPPQFIYLDPMDIVSLTDPELEISSSDWVRILTMQEQEDGSILFSAEEYGSGHASTANYAFSQGSGYAANYNVDPGDINVPIIFEPPVQLATNTGLESWGAFSGDNQFWGGCDVYLSSDDITYNFIGRHWGQSRQGVLTAAFGAGASFAHSNVSARSQKTRFLGEFTANLRNTAAPGGAFSSWPQIHVDSRVRTDWSGATPFSGDPDTAHFASVDLTESFGTLSSGSPADADAGNTACIVDSEIFSFSDANLTATYQYTLDNYIRRGQFGTSIAAHAPGALFARLDDGMFVIPYDKDQIGNTVYIKACSFNLWGGGLQDLSVVTAYPHLIVGPPTPAVVQNFTAEQVGLTVVLEWTDLVDFSLKGYDILYGVQGDVFANAKLLTTASRTTETTTAKVGPGLWTFYILARNIADQLGPVSQVNVNLNAFQQTFDLSGLWTKPGGISATSMAHVEVWAGGGGAAGNGNGGGGGGYNDLWIPVSQLGATEIVTVAAGGAGGAVNNPGGGGGASSFGSWVQSFGGGAGFSNGSNASGGGGGGITFGGSVFAGANGGAGGGPLGGAGGVNSTGPPAQPGYTGGGGADQGAASPAGAGIVGGGGGGAGSSSVGGSSVWGGGGGAGINAGGSGGVSVNGGNGGDNAQPGVVPLGGGGGLSATHGGAGAHGRVRITVIP